MELNGWPAVAVLSAPLVVMSILLIVHARRGSANRRSPVPAQIATGRYGIPIPEERTPRAAEPRRPMPSAPPRAGVDELLTSIAKATASGDERRLCELRLALAETYMTTGRATEASDNLRHSIRISARLGMRDAHARARLELGDIARASGDLTTACEHWQIARGLFFDLKSAAELESAEARMQANGCPTDWVLNDF